MLPRKPSCSYNCLIGMALKSSGTGRLPVGEIYRFFEREFPYFLTAAEPWKNSLRHSLSLGHFFRKYNSDKMLTKKGHLWEVEPHKSAELDKEIYMFLAKAVPDNLPSTSQLAVLRVQMTQLYLDSKNKHACSYSGHLLTSQGQYFPQRIPEASNALVDSVNCQGVVSRQSFNSNLALHIPSSTMSSGVADGTSSHSSLQYNGIATAPILFNYSQESTNNIEGDIQGGQKSEAISNFQKEKIPHVSEEAMQLIRFCNHCSFELLGHSNSSDRNQGSTVNLDSSKDVKSIKGIIGRKKLTGKSNDINKSSSSASLPAPCEETDDKHYPFITEPKGDCNLTLAKLNDGGYHTEPGPPRELLVKKCPRGRRNGSLRKSCASLESAIRPVTTDWNSWWEREYIICILNDDAFINSVECYIDENAPKEDCSRSTKKHRPKKKLRSSFLTPIKDSKLGPLTNSHIKVEKGKITTLTPAKKDAGSTKNDNDSNGKSSTVSKAKTPKKCPTESQSTRTKVAGICKNVHLIISIPFHKLITERQFKKYYGEGGKQRILTGQ